MLLELVNDLRRKIIDADLSQYSDDEISALYKKCNDGLRYYEGMQRTVKDCANSVYGANGSTYYRFFNIDVASDIPYEAKELMNVVDSSLNAYFQGWEKDPTIEELLQKRFDDPSIKIHNTHKDICIYGDTDSRYVDYGEIFECANFKPTTADQVIDFILFMHENRIDKVMHENMNKYIIARNGEVGHMVMELEQIGGKGFFLQKKKYIMSLLWKDGRNISKQGKHKAVGIELIQGSSSSLVKVLMRKMLNRLLVPGTSIDTIMRIGAQIYSYAKTVDKKELCKITGVGEYSKFIIDDKDELCFTTEHTIPIQMRAAAQYNHFMHKNGHFSEGFERISPGDKIYWYYTVDGGVFGLHEDVKYGQFPGMPEMNVNIQIEKLILKPLKRFLFSKDVDGRKLGQKTIQRAFIPRKKI